MSANWNDTFDDSTDWSSLEFQQMFWNAFKERALAEYWCLNEDSYPGPGGGTAGDYERSTLWYNTVPPTEGADIQGAVLSSTAVATDLHSPLVLQTYTQRVMAFCSNIDPNGVAGQTGWTLSEPFRYKNSADRSGVWHKELYDAAGLSYLTPYDTKAGSVAGFTRKYPKNFWNTQTRYENGNSWSTNWDEEWGPQPPSLANSYYTIMPGNRPFYGGYPDPFVEGDNALCNNDGKVYTRTSGVWVLAPTGTQPDTVTTLGLMRPGDYIGPWIWNEIRDCFNQMTRVTCSVRNAISLSNTRHYSGPCPSSATSLDLAKATSDANWGSVGTNTNYIAFAQSTTTASRGPVYYATREHQSFDISIHTDSNLTCNRTVKVYALTQILGQSYDASGVTSGGQNNWGLVGSIASTSDSLALADVMGAASDKPNWCGTPSDPVPPWYGSSGRSSGFQLATFTMGYSAIKGHLIAILDYGVSGGFQYTAST
jgi:hypothetical protein